MERYFTKMLPALILIIYLTRFCQCDVPVVNFDYPGIKDEIYEQPVEMMAAMPVKSPHAKDQKDEPKQEVHTKQDENAWAPFEFSNFESYLNTRNDAPENNRIKRRAKRRHGGRRRSRPRMMSTARPDENKVESGNASDSSSIMLDDARRSEGKKRKNKKSGGQYDMYNPPIKEYESNFIEMPKDLYQAHLRPGVIFRIHLSEAVLKMQYRNYGEDKDESVIEADVEYLRLTRKVINDELTKFEDLKWLIGWFNNRSDLIQEHMCNTRYFAVGIPPTMFTHSEEYMKRMCLFDNVYIDHIPYVVGEDGSLMAAVAPPVLHCDAATCTSVPFIDSIMFDEKLSRTNVRTLTRCQASCRAHCRNDPDCLKRCSDRCLRAEKK